VTDLLRVAIVLGLVAGNAFFVAAEYAIVTARRAPLSMRADAGSRRAAAALRLMDEPVRVISTVQVGVSAVSILAGAVGEPLVRDMLGEDVPPWLGFLVAFGIVTYLTVVLGELVPKAIALDRAERLAAAFAPALELAGAVLRPVVTVLHASAHLVLRPLGIRHVAVGATAANAEELREIVDEAERIGAIPRAQEELLHAVFEFADLEAADVMVPAADVTWLDADLSAEHALERALGSRHARFPVGRGSLDRIVGIVHVRWLMQAARAGGTESIGALARPPFIVPETKDLGALLNELRRRHEHLAIVLDEYGGTTGIVTMEDILEEIVGEIENEYGLTEEAVRRINSRSVEAAGSMTIDDFNELLGTDLPQRGVRTLAGLVFEQLGRLPAVGETARFDGVQLQVRAVEGTRITTIRVTLPPGQAAPQRAADGSDSIRP
jgi:putative hemolysin